jgi:hypothetical protein
MPVNRNFWKHTYFVAGTKGVPAYLCPNCQRSTLSLMKDTQHEFECERSRQHQRDVGWGPEFYFGVFSCLLRCSSEHCKEIVAVSGYSGTEHLGEDGDLMTVLVPQMFSPPLHLFQIPEECPDDVKKEIVDAFKLYWSDEAGAMNHLRKAVEIIMDHLGIPRRKRNNKGKLSRLDLHRRIDLFGAKNADLAARLEAVKWLGNVGSHASDEVTKEDVFDGCDLLEDFIQTHFERRGKKIIALTGRIIKRFRKK